MIKTEKHLKKRRDRKWKKFKERYNLNSFSFRISENQFTSLSAAISEKEKNYQQGKRIARTFRIKECN